MAVRHTTLGAVANTTTGVARAMYVGSVNGSDIAISQFNYDDTGDFCWMVVASTGRDFIHF